MALILLATTQQAFSAAGLLDAEVFEVLHFDSMEFLFPGREVSLNDEAYEHL